MVAVVGRIRFLLGLPKWGGPEFTRRLVVPNECGPDRQPTRSVWPSVRWPGGRLEGSWVTHYGQVGSAKCQPNIIHDVTSQSDYWWCHALVPSASDLEDKYKTTYKYPRINPWELYFSKFEFRFVLSSPCANLSFGVPSSVFGRSGTNWLLRFIGARNSEEDGWTIQANRDPPPHYKVCLILVK